MGRLILQKNLFFSLSNPAKKVGKGGMVLVIVHPLVNIPHRNLVFFSLFQNGDFFFCRHKREATKKQRKYFTKSPRFSKHTYTPICSA